MSPEGITRAAAWVIDWTIYAAGLFTLADAILGAARGWVS